MGNKDRTRDENAATSTDASRDQESRDAALAGTITVAVAGALVQHFQNKRQKRHSHSQKHSKGRWRRHMHSLMSF